MSKTKSQSGTSTPRFRRYPEYKESGVEWLGEIPAHWEVRRLKTVASVQPSSVDKKSLEGQESVRLCNYVDVYYNDHITPDLDFMAATATAEQIRRFSLRRGDVLITKDSESWTDIAVPAVVESDLPDVLCGYHLALVRPAPACDGRFLARAFSARGPRDQFQIAANGITRFGLTGDALRTGLFALPPSVAEQDAIANFLDRETARIDALVAKKERLIELLQEKRSALITSAVTKGLDPNASLKDSGVERFGQIPAHWAIVRLGRLAKVANGSTPSREEPEYWADGSVPWLTSGKINEGIIKHADEFVTHEALRKCHLPLVRRGSVLIAITGEGQTRGKTALLATDATISQHLAAAAPRAQRLCAEFLWRFLQAQYTWLRSESGGAGSTRAALTLEFLKAVPIAVPPVDEQLRIIKVAESIANNLDSLLEKVGKAIQDINELRTALISAAVTGKIDVREDAS